MKLKKVLSGVIAATMAVTTIAITPVFSSAELIVVGENVVDSGTELGAKTNLGSVDWGGSIKINAADLSDYPVGTPVKVDIATTGETGGQVYIVDGSDWSASATWYNNPGATVYVELTEAMKENGIMFNGSDADISKVSFLDFTKYTKIKTFSDLGSVSWGGAVKIESSELSDIPVGAILKVGIKTTGDDGGQVYVVDGSNWSASATWYNKPGADVLIEFTSDMQSNGIMCNGSDADIESITAWIDLIAVESVTINETELALKKGETATLTATVEPEDATDKTVTWESSAPAIATVDENGKVTAKKSGSAIITATAGEESATCEVTVTNPATAIAFENTTETVLIGEANAKTLAVTTTPTDADELTYTWNSSKLEVATVANGVVTGVAAGEAVITVTAGTLTASCTVTVTAETKPATKVTLDKTTLTLEEEKTDTLTATITPADSTDSITWTSSAPAVATVDQTGKVTAVAEGTATITAKANDEVSATCAVTVTAKPEPPEETDEPTTPDKPTASDVLWEGKTDMGTSWGASVSVDAAAVSANDIIKITYTVGSASYHQLKIMDSSWNVLTSLDGIAHAEYGTVAVSGDPYTVTLTAADAAAITKSGLVISGYDVTVTKVERVAGTATAPTGYETGKVETVSDYVPAEAPAEGTKTELMVNSISKADAAKYSHYDVTIKVTLEDGTVKTATKSVSDCYGGFSYNNGKRVEKAENGYFLLVKVKGVPESAKVEMSIKGIV